MHLIFCLWTDSTVKAKTMPYCFVLFPKLLLLNLYHISGEDTRGTCERLLWSLLQPNWNSSLKLQKKRNIETERHVRHFKPLPFVFLDDMIEIRDVVVCKRTLLLNFGKSNYAQKTYRKLESGGWGVTAYLIYLQWSYGSSLVI